MKMGFVSKDRTSKGRMGKEDFKRLFNSILRGVTKEESKHIYTLIMPLLEDSENQNDILYDKLNTLCDFYQYYPMIIKKDKN